MNDNNARMINHEELMTLNVIRNLMRQSNEYNNVNNDEREIIDSIIEMLEVA